MQWIYGLGVHRMTGDPLLAGVATFIFSTAPRQTLGLIHHPVKVYDSVVLHLHSLKCSRVWSLMKHKDKFTFTSCKYGWHYIAQLSVECKKNVITNKSIPAFQKEITTSFPWLGVHILKRSSHYTAQNQEGTNYTRNTLSKWHILKSATCSGWIQFIHFVTTLC